MTTFDLLSLLKTSYNSGMNNQTLLNRSLQSVWHPCTQMKQHETYPLIPIQRGDGVWLFDSDGKRYLDTVSSWWVNLFGHNNPRIKDAIKRQLDTLEHVMLAGFTHEPVVELSEKLARLTGLGHAFYGSDGASATEIALKMSYHYWHNTGHLKKTKFISLKHSYHGETLGALSVTDVAIFKDTYAPLLIQSAQMPCPDFRLAELGESSETFALRCALSVENYVAIHHEELAAYIVEPLIQCAAGMGMYHPTYLRRVREICNQYKVHLIADEIAVGFGRTGTMFACEQAEIKPDFICLSKGITGGYLPLSAVLTTDQVYQAFYDNSTVRGFLHSHSYTGNPLACSAALATLAIFESDNILKINHEKSVLIQAKMQVINDLPVKHIRHCGMVFAFDVVTQNSNFSRQCYQLAVEHELILRPIGNTVYWMPPYTITEAEIDFMVNKTYQVIRSVL
jgi:adenosylmethionine-8-amino-7-oxononanoate aminotransferase